MIKRSLKTSVIFAISLLGLSSLHALPAPSCTDSSRECVIAASTTYLDALVSHDPSHVPFDRNAERWENGANTGTSGQSISDGLKNDYRFKVIQGIRDVHWMVDGDQAIAYYLLDSIIPDTSVHVSTTHIAEKFIVKQGKIMEIEAIFCNSMTMSPEESKISSSNPPSILCNRSKL